MPPRAASAGRALGGQAAASASMGAGGGGAAASSSSTSAPKRKVADPQGPVMELLQSFGVRDKGGFYDVRIRGKYLRLDNTKNPTANAPSTKAAGTGRRAGRCKEVQGRDQWKGLRFADFEPLRALWHSYIEDLQLGSGQELSKGLAAADLHGCTLEVVAAKNPGCVRLRGTVLEETQNTFRIITSDNRIKVLPKECSVFEVVVLGERVRLLGPAWAFRLPRGAPGPQAPQAWSLG
mmetsp:Transcript_43992/g.125958  ORF Transcript_43992/g.125958 Transcript_43992/m.125958 type:complete len:236 (+) Transcript_43992:102-809(+)